MSEMDNLHSPPQRGCPECPQLITRMVVQGLVHNDHVAWRRIADHFEPDVKVLVASSPSDCQQDVLSDVMLKLFSAVNRIDVYKVGNVHGYVHRAMRNAKIGVLRKRSRRLRNETFLTPEWDVAAPNPGGDGTHLPKPRGAEEASVRRCLDALRKARANPKNSSLDVMSIDVIRIIFIADLDGERIDRVEACRRLGLREEHARLSEKLARIRSAEDSQMHQIIRNIDPKLFTLLEHRVSPKEEN